MSFSRFILMRAGLPPNFSISVELSPNVAFAELRIRFVKSHTSFKNSFRLFTALLRSSLSFSAKSTFSAALEILVRGTQTINNQVFNLVGEDEFNNTIFFGRGSLGMKYPISNNTSIYANYKYGRTVLIGQSNAVDKEELNLIAHQFGIGLIINLPSCNCPF